VAGDAPAAAQGSVDSPASPASLYRKLLWLTGLRLIVGTALLVATAWLTLGGDTDFGRRVDALLYATIASIYLGSLVSVIFLRRGRHLRPVAYAQIAGDVLAATGLVYLTGGAESFFTILYPIAIVNAAISLSRRGAIAGAVASILSFCALALAMERGVLSFPAAFFERPPLTASHLALSLAANVSAFVLTAALSAYLADALQGARRQLAHSETQLSALSLMHESIVRSINSGIITTDGRTRITYLNPAGEEITGLRSAELAGEPLDRRFPDFAAALTNSQQAGRGETRLVRAGGDGRVVGYSIAPLVDLGMPGLPGYVIVFQDLTTFRELEEAMRRNDRLAAVGKLAAGLAHELRNPLASMCGSIELLHGAPGLHDKERRLMRIVLREGERLEQLVRDFLTFARPLKPQLAPVDATAEVNEALSIFRGEAAARGLSLDAHIEPALFVRADPAQLKQVLWNLLNNAAEATSAGGRLSVKLERDGGRALLQVEDSGVGIAAEDLSHIFDPFFTTKERGTGLGLSIVHRIVEGHGGSIEVRSEPGRGTTFRIGLIAQPASGGEERNAGTALISST
jgi:two-component system sensor histidine kinase PilS (NtrC family)